MRKLYELRDKLCEQLEEYNDRELTSATLDVVDKLTHTIKNLDKIIDKCEEEKYSGAYYSPRYMRRGDMSYDMDRGTRRDGMGRYSGGYPNNSEMIVELNKLMNNAPDEHTRMELQKFIQKMENM